VDVDGMLENSSDDIYIPEHLVDLPASPTPSLDPDPASVTDTPSCEATYMKRDIDFDVQTFDLVSSSQKVLNSQAISCTFHDFELALPKSLE
ncbi:hypothetical protein V5O48_019175, partial [Marasmius crinis-equi]